VHRLANTLIECGYEVVFDMHHDPKEGWAVWMSRELDRVDFVLIICTQTYKQRAQQLYDEKYVAEEKNENQENPVGTGVKFEGGIILNKMLNSGNQNSRYVPVLLDDAKPNDILDILSAASRYSIDTQNNLKGFAKLRRKLDGTHTYPTPEPGEYNPMPPLQSPSAFTVPEAESAPIPGNTSVAANIDISNLPTTTTTLFGREKQLQMLNDDWFNPNTNIRCLIAWGGVGKTSLINTWLSQLREENYRNARVLGYSFYSQGSSDDRHDRQVSVESFVQVLINWLQLSEQQHAAMPNSAHEKGVYLANLILKQKSLLILDGLEPMQFPPGNDAKHTGTLKDATLKALLKQLATAAPGDNSPLLVITSRLSVTDLQNFFNTSVQEHSLDNLSIDAGIQLLKHLGVKGRQTELEKAVKEVAGHALAVTLLGTFVAEECDGDIQQRDTLPSLTEEGSQGHHAKRVIAQYQQWLQHSDKPDINILYLMSLFDRPTEHYAIAALLNSENEAIEGVTDRLTGLSSNSSHYWQGLDCHPLIREYFAEQLRHHNPKGYQAAHQRLYEYFKTVPEKQQPDTVQEMEPLFMAVAHGCKAGLHQQTIDEVYWPRIRREGNNYIVNQLGAFGADLACVAHFFQQTWDVPVQVLNEAAKAIALNWAAFCLRGLGRLQEAVQPFEAVLNLVVKNKYDESAAKSASNLSQLLLSIGQVDNAVNAGEQAVHYADLSEDENWQFVFRTTLADTLYHRASTASIERVSDNKSESGSDSKTENKTEIKTESENAHNTATPPIASNPYWQRALKLFKEAEQRQQQRQPEFKYLYSLQGFRYCQLLLSLGRVEEVVERANHGKRIALRNGWLLGVALDELSLGKANLQKFKPLFSVSGSEAVANISEQAQVLFSNNPSWLNQAVEGLRDAVQQDYLIRGLFARTEFFTFIQHHTAAWHDLDEAYDIAIYGGMQLFLTDYYLAAAEDIQTQLGWRKGSQTLAQELGLELDFGLDDRACEDRDLGDRAGTEAESATDFVIKEQGRLLHPTQTEMEQRVKDYLKKAGKLIQECNYFLHKQRLQTLKDKAAEHGL